MERWGWFWNQLISLLLLIYRVVTVFPRIEVLTPPWKLRYYSEEIVMLKHPKYNHSDRQKPGKSIGEGQWAYTDSGNEAWGVVAKAASSTSSSPANEARKGHTEYGAKESKRYRTVDLTEFPAKATSWPGPTFAMFKVTQVRLNNLKDQSATRSSSQCTVDGRVWITLQSSHSSSCHVPWYHMSKKYSCSRWKC